MLRLLRSTTGSSGRPSAVMTCVRATPVTSKVMTMMMTMTMTMTMPHRAMSSGNKGPGHGASSGQRPPAHAGAGAGAAAAGGSARYTGGGAQTPNHPAHGQQRDQAWGQRRDGPATSGQSSYTPGGAAAGAQARYAGGAQTYQGGAHRGGAQGQTFGGRRDGPPGGQSQRGRDHTAQSSDTNNARIPAAAIAAAAATPAAAAAAAAATPAAATESTDLDRSAKGVRKHDSRALRERQLRDEDDENDNDEYVREEDEDEDMENEDAGPNRRYRGDLIGDTLLPGSIRVHGKEERPKIVGTKTQRMHHMNKQQRVQAAQEDLKLEVLSSSALPPTSGNYQKALNRIPAAVVAPGLATALRGPSKPAHFQGGRTTASERDQQKFEKQVQEEMAVVVKRETEKLHKPIPMDKLQEVIGNRLVILLDENRAMVSRAPPKSAAAPPATAVPPPTPEGQPKLDAAAKAELKAAERARKLAALREAAYSAAEIVELAQQRKCDISLIDTQPERITLQLASTAIFEKAEAEMKNRLAQAESAIRTKIRNFNNRKEVQLTNSTAENDLKLKIVRARRFLKRGNLVMITVLFRRARKRTAKPFNRQDQERQMKLIMDAISDISTTGPEHFVLKTTMMSCLFMPNEKAKDAVVNIYNPTEEEDDDDDDDEDDLESEDEEDSSSDDDDSSSSDDDSSSSSDDDDDEQGQNAPAVQSNKNAKKQGGKAPAETKPTEKPAMSKYQMKLLQRQQAGSQPQQAQFQPRSSSKQ